MRVQVFRWMALLLGMQSFAWYSRALAWCQMTTSDALPSNAEPCVRAENHRGSFPAAWLRPCSALSFSETQPSRSMNFDQVTAVFRAGLDTWENADCGGGTHPGVHVEILPLRNQCTEGSYRTNARNVNSVMFVQEGWSTLRKHDPGAYAVTLVWTNPRSGEILDVDMEINEEFRIQNQPVIFGQCTSSGCPPNTIDLLNVVTHELGHYFGLAHTPDDSEATMWSTASSNEIKKRDLQPDDVQGICSVYPPGNLPGVCDIAPTNGLGLSCTTTGVQCDEWGLGPNGFSCSASCSRSDDFYLACRSPTDDRPSYCSMLGGASIATPCGAQSSCSFSQSNTRSSSFGWLGLIFAVVLARRLRTKKD